MFNASALALPLVQPPDEIWQLYVKIEQDHRATATAKAKEVISKGKKRGTQLKVSDLLPMTLMKSLSSNL